MAVRRDHRWRDRHAAADRQPPLRAVGFDADDAGGDRKELSRIQGLAPGRGANERGQCHQDQTAGKLVGDRHWNRYSINSPCSSINGTLYSRRMVAMADRLSTISFSTTAFHSRSP